MQIIKFFKKIDPIYQILRITLYRNIFKQLSTEISLLTKLKNDTSDGEKLYKAEQLLKNAELTLEDIKTNIHKQSLSISSSLILLYFTLRSIKNMADSQIDPTLPLLIIGPILSGFIVSWYIITFGSIKKEFLKEGFSITFFMFTTFIMSINILGLIAWYFLPSGLREPIQIIILFAEIGSFKYDMLDLLRVGIDSEGLKFYIRANEKMEREEYPLL